VNRVDIREVFLADIANMQDDHTSNISDLQVRRISDAEEAWIAACSAQFDRLDAENLQEKFGDLLNHMMPGRVRAQSQRHMLRYPLHRAEHDFSHLSPVHMYFDQPVRLTLNKEPASSTGYWTQAPHDDDSESMGSVDDDEDAASEDGSIAASDVMSDMEMDYYTREQKIPVHIPVDDSEFHENDDPVEYTLYVQCQKPAISVRTTEAQQEFMRGAVFQHFVERVRVAVAAQRAAFADSAPHNNTAECAELCAVFETLLARIADMQHIRPYIIDLSCEYIIEYIAHCGRPQVQPPVYFSQTSLAAIPEDIRAMAPYVTYLCVGSTSVPSLPAWMHEFRALTILDLRGTQLLYSYPLVREHFNHVMQTLPASLWQLHALQHLSLRNFAAIPMITEDLRRMTSLKTLRLYNMFRLGTSILPLSLTTLPVLETLRVSWCLHSTTPAWFSDAAVSLPRLLELHIGNNQIIQKIPQDLAVFPSLLRLKLENMRRLTRMPSLSSLRHLQSLRLHNLGALGWSFFDVHATSHRRAYNHNAIFTGLRRLQSLELCNMDRFETLPTSMTDLDALQILLIEHTPVSVPTWIPALSNLTTLHLKDMSNIWRLPPGMTCMHALEQVHLAQLDMSELPDDICALVHVKTLSLTFLPQLRALPEQIGAMCAMQSLSIRGCRSLLELPEEFALLSNMRSLEIIDCDGLLRHNSDTLQYVAQCTALTELRIGPSEQAEFPLALRQLVCMQNFCVCLAHATVCAPPDPDLFRKLTVIVSCMPLLRHLQITHVREGHGPAPLLGTNNVSSVIHSLRAYPLQFLTELRLDQIYSITSHWSQHQPTSLGEYARSEYNYDLPPEATLWKPDQFRAHWLRCQEKMRVYMEVFHPRLGQQTRARVCDPSICTKLIAGHVMYRNEFDDFVQEFDHL